MASEHAPELERRLAVALAILRITVGLFFLLWAVEKFVLPDATVAIWERFYKIPISSNLAYPIGVVNTLMSLALIVGFMPTITYGYWIVFHGISVLSTRHFPIKPFGGPNQLFLAGVPMPRVRFFRRRPHV